MSDDKGDKSQVIAMLEQRRIEALIVKNIYEVLVKRHGESEAKVAIREAIKNAAIEQGANFAKQHGGEPSLKDFSELGRLWEMGGALKRDMLHKSKNRLEYNIVHCAYADMYKRMGLAHIGDLLSCNRDGTFCIGYNPKMKLTRTQTIMEGAEYCDFRYEMQDEVEG